jgi:hypothetical protein
MEKWMYEERERKEEGRKRTHLETRLERRKLELDEVNLGDFGSATKSVGRHL